MLKVSQTVPGFNSYQQTGISFGIYAEGVACFKLRYFVGLSMIMIENFRPLVEMGCEIIEIQKSCFGQR